MVEEPSSSILALTLYAKPRLETASSRGYLAMRRTFPRATNAATCARMPQRYSACVQAHTAELGPYKGCSRTELATRLH